MILVDASGSPIVLPPKAEQSFVEFYAYETVGCAIAHTAAEVEISDGTHTISCNRH